VQVPNAIPPHTNALAKRFESVIVSPFDAEQRYEMARR
jgi:hypothetical protein